MSQQEKYAELFAAEAREHLEEIGRALVAIESEPGDIESLNAVFRSVHTIKGMAAAMGYDAASRLSHNIESVLDELRSGRRSVDAPTIDLLLESADLLENTVDATVAGEESPDPERVIERLVVWRLSGGATPAEGAASSAEDAPSGVGRIGPTSRSPLRADSSRLRVDIRRLDALMNLIGELTIVRNQLRALSQQLGSESLQETVERAGRLIAEMQAEVVESRMVPVWQVFDRFPRLVRDGARSAGKEVELVIRGKDLELDRSLLDAISDPLVHLLRNAVDHGIEAPEERERVGKPRGGRIELTARRERSRIVIDVSDDGRGIDREQVLKKARQDGLVVKSGEPTDQELFRIMARPGFSTMKRVTELSGRGVGLNVVDDSIRALGGSVEFTTAKGEGTTFRLQLPLTLAIVHALIVRIAGQVYALPATFTRESFQVPATSVQRVHGREWVPWRGGRIPLTRLQSLFNGGEVEGNGDALNLVALEFGGAPVAISVDDFLGEEEVVIKPVDLPLGAVPVFSGATVRPNGQPALVLDVGSLS